MSSKINHQSIHRLPDYGKAIEAGQNIFTLINRKPVIDNESKDGDEIVCFTLMNYCQ